MHSSLEGKTAFVKAAGQGIGRACGEALTRQGATVVASDLDQATIEDVALQTPRIITGQAFAIDGRWSI